MSSLNRAVNVFNQWIRFPKEARAMFYEVMEAQLEAGLPLKKVFEVLHRDLNVSPEITRVSAAGYQAISQGQLGTEGLAGCNLLPVDEAYLLIAAEKKDVLIQVLRQLRERAEADATFFQDVIATNLYYIVLVSLLGYMALKTKDLATAFGNFVSLDDNPAYQLSLTLNEYGTPVAFSVVIVSIFVWFCANHWYHPLRRYVWFFSTDIQLQIGVKFSALSSAFYSIGATHSDVLQAATAVFHGSGFMRGALADLIARYESEGDSYNEALGDTVLHPDIAMAIMAMTPAEDRAAFSRAHVAAEKLQISLIKQRHGKAKLLVQLVLLGAISYMLLTMLIGLYSIYNF